MRRDAKIRGVAKDRGWSGGVVTRRGKAKENFHLPRSSTPLANLFEFLSPTCADSLIAIATCEIT